MYWLVTYYVSGQNDGVEETWDLPLHPLRKSSAVDPLSYKSFQLQFLLNFPPIDYLLEKRGSDPIKTVPNMPA